MTSQSSAGQASRPPSDEDIAAFLERDPEFFLRHPQLVARLEIPHECGSASSLLTYQIRQLRGDNQRLRSRLDELLQVARDNDRLAEQLHRLSLELLDAQDRDALVAALREGLREQCRADLVSVALFPDPREAPGPDTLPEHAREAFADLLERGTARLGRLPATQAELLFGTEGGQRVASAAVVPVRDNHRIRGVMAVGSEQGDRYHPGQGTLFLEQLGAVAGRALRGSGTGSD